MGYTIKATPQEKRQADQRAVTEHQIIYVMRIKQERIVASLDEIWRDHKEDTCHTLYVAQA